MNKIATLPAHKSIKITVFDPSQSCENLICLASNLEKPPRKKSVARVTEQNNAPTIVRLVFHDCCWREVQNIFDQIAISHTISLGIDSERETRTGCSLSTSHLRRFGSIHSRYLRFVEH